MISIFVFLVWWKMSDIQITSSIILRENLHHLDNCMSNILVFCKNSFGFFHQMPKSYNNYLNNHICWNKTKPFKLWVSSFKIWAGEIKKESYRQIWSKQMKCHSFSFCRSQKVNFDWRLFSGWESLVDCSFAQSDLALQLPGGAHHRVRGTNNYGPCITFSCEDTALQVRMYVCLSISLW